MGSTLPAGTLGGGGDVQVVWLITMW